MYLLELVFSFSSDKHPQTLPSKLDHFWDQGNKCHPRLSWTASVTRGYAGSLDRWPLQSWLKSQLPPGCPRHLGLDPHRSSLTTCILTPTHRSCDPLSTLPKPPRLHQDPRKGPGLPQACAVPGMLQLVLNKYLRNKHMNKRCPYWM